MGDYPNEVTLQQMVVFYGPLSVRFDGNHRSFQHYKGGKTVRDYFLRRLKPIHLLRLSSILYKCGTDKYT